MSAQQFSPLVTTMLVVGLVFGSGDRLDARTWTNAKGTEQVEADFIDVQSDKVWLRRLDGRTFKVSVDELCKADREHIDQLLKRQEAEIEAWVSRAKPGTVYGNPRKLGDLGNKNIDESSGLISSRRHAGLFWTHNDSGNDANLYLIDREGHDRGVCVVADVFAYDWEDVAAVTLDGKPHLLVADVGNNGRAAAVHMLHLVEEPSLDERGNVAMAKVPVARTLYFSYEDDHRNCEAVAVDPTDRTILFISKERGDPASVYALKWPEDTAKRARPARRIGTLNLPAVTALDVSPDGLRAIVLTYRDAYEFDRDTDGDWAGAFATPPRRIKMPDRIQGESICYGPDGKTLYLTSEKRPTPLWEVPEKGGQDSLLRKEFRPENQ